MKLKQRIEKHRDEQVRDLYWSSVSQQRPSVTEMEFFKRGFDCAVQFLLAQKDLAISPVPTETEPPYSEEV